MWARLRLPACVTDRYSRSPWAVFRKSCRQRGYGKVDLVLAATDSLVREAAPAGKGANYIIPLTDIVIFAMFISFALRSRCRPSAHKRHLYSSHGIAADCGDSSLALAEGEAFTATRVFHIFPRLVVAYDLGSTCRVIRSFRTGRLGKLLLHLLLQLLDQAFAGTIGSRE